MAIVYGPQAFVVSSDTAIDQFPSAGSPDFARNDPPGNALTVQAANDRVQSADTFNTTIARCMAAGMPTGDQEVQATVYASTSTADRGQVFVRLATDGTANGYSAEVESGVLYLRRLSAITGISDLASGARTFTTGLHTLRLKVTGTNPVLLEAQLDATAIVTYSDSDAARITSGVPGLGIYQFTANLASVDQFQVDNLLGPVLKTASDTGRPVLSEARSLLGRSSASDTGRPILSEARSLVSRSTRSDPLTPLLSEQATVRVIGTADSLVLGLTEARSLVARSPRTDTLLPIVSETRSLVSRTSASETGLPVLSEQAALVGRSTRPDSLTPILSEQAQLKQSSSATDTVRPLLVGEGGTVQVIGVIAKTAADTLRPVLIDIAQVIPTLAGADSLPPVLSEARALAAASLRPDLLRPILTEPRTLAARSSLVEALTPVLIETPALLASTAQRADSLHVFLSETAALVVRSAVADLLPVILQEGTLGVVPVIPVAAADVLAPVLSEGPAHLVRQDLAPIIGRLHLVSVGLACAGSCPTLTLKPATRGAVKVTYAVVSHPRAL